MLRLIFPLFLLLGGCVSLDEVVGGIANTPEWFQERRVEIRGEGYPDINDVPEQENAAALRNTLASAKTGTLQELEAFLNDPRVEAASVTAEEITERAAELNRQLPVLEEKGDALLTASEIAALRAQVRPPPINKPK